MNIKTNSKEVEKGDKFIAIKGLNVDGHDYVQEAIDRGAEQVIVEHGNYDIDTIHVEDTKQYLIDYLCNNYGTIISQLKLIGVTGTNGKTTSCFLIYQMLNKSNIPCAYIGTIGCYIKDKIIKLSNTTPDILELYTLLLQCYEEGIKYVVMEVSSHALDLKRVAGLEFNYAIYTNLTVDHLDYHHDLDSYAECKQKLFYMLKKDGIAIINNDDKYKKIMLVHSNNNTYGFKKGSDYQLISFNNNNTQTNFTFKYEYKTYNVTSPLLGQYNVYNILTMIITLHKIGLSLSEIIEKVPILKAPPGRMDTITHQKKTIIVDYAHTPDAVFNVLTTIKEFSKGRIYSIIGCGGNRDKTKRSKMAFYATCLSDHVIITSDNPRNEDPIDIVKDMLKGIVKTNYEVVIDRKDAIKRGINILNDNDILIILGKGHEDYQIIGDQKLYHNDKQYVLELCK